MKAWLTAQFVSMTRPAAPAVSWTTCFAIFSQPAGLPAYHKQPSPVRWVTAAK